MTGCRQNLHFSTANQINIKVRFASRAPSISLSTSPKSNFPSVGSISSQETVAMTEFRFFLASLFHTGFMYSPRHTWSWCQLTGNQEERLPANHKSRSRTMFFKMGNVLGRILRPLAYTGVFGWLNRLPRQEKQGKNNAADVHLLLSSYVVNHSGRVRRVNKHAGWFRKKSSHATSSPWRT